MMCHLVAPNHTMPMLVPFDCYTSMYRLFGGFNHGSNHSP